MGKIMVVDDSEDIRKSLVMIMQKKGHETYEAESGNELVEKFDKIQPDLVLLDVMMPGYSLDETLGKLEGKDTKIILVTVVRFMKEEKDDIMKNPLVVDYVTKPFDLMDVVKRVNNALG
ncbi:MAG: response regulator [Nanobdellota archaeon]